MTSSQLVPPMRKLRSNNSEKGNVLLCVVCTIVIVSAIGANVLLNCVTRFNASASQVRSWKASLDAAEAGGDIAFAEVRNTIIDPTHAFSGWDYTGGVRTNSPGVTFGADNFIAKSRVDIFWTDANGQQLVPHQVRGNGPGFGNETRRNGRPHGRRNPRRQSAPQDRFQLRPFHRDLWP